MSRSSGAVTVLSTFQKSGMRGRARIHMSLKGDRRKKFSGNSKRLSGLVRDDSKSDISGRFLSNISFRDCHPHAPHSAQMIGELFPLTHFLRIVRGILLKGNGLPDIIPQLWQIALFIVVAMTIAVKRYRRTLD